MKKSYINPRCLPIDLSAEQMIAGSMVLSDDYVDTQLSNKKDENQDMWGNESVWK